jgi:hypothetical protein
MQELHFSRGNLAGDDHPSATIASTYLLVVCDVPSSITLIANEPGTSFCLNTCEMTGPIVV